MRTRMILAALMASALSSPALAQADRRGEWRQERMDRGDVRQSEGGTQQRGTWQRSAPAPQTPRAQPMPVPAAPPQRDWSGNRGGGNGGWQRPQPPVVANQQPPAPDARHNWGGGSGRGWDHRGNGSGGAIPSPQPGIDIHRGGNAGTWSNNGGTRNWDRNNRGSVDRRYDRNQDGVRDNRYGWNNRGNGWDHDWRNDRRYDWQGWRYQNRNLFHAPRYYAPYGYGYGYQRFGIGIYLNNVFFGSSYWISDPWAYRLPSAQWPYRWVRYYDDVLLVDTRSGYVVDVIYDFFW